MCGVGESEGPVGERGLRHVCLTVGLDAEQKRDEAGNDDDHPAADADRRHDPLVHRFVSGPARDAEKLRDFFDNAVIEAAAWSGLRDFRKGFGLATEPGIATLANALLDQEINDPEREGAIGELGEL